MIIFITFSYSGNLEVFASCDNAISELVHLRNNKTDGYKTDSMTLKLIIDKQTKDFYVKVNRVKSKLVVVSTTNDYYQFIEPVGSGHKVLYTLHRRKLTIQKSYSLLGTPVMVNTILDCK